MIGAVITDLQHQVTRLTGTERAVDRTVVCRQQVLDRLALVFESEVRTDELQDLVKLVLGRVDDRDFVRNSASKRAVDKLPRFEVCRENNELIERDLNLDRKSVV